MYFSSKLSIDPTQCTKIHKVKPTKAFKKFLYYITAGGVSDKIEQQSFTAVSILQQLFQCFSSLDVKNIVRLARNGENFYLDTEGKDNDLKCAMDQFELNADQLSDGPFETLDLILEHSHHNTHYFIDIKIHRTHKKDAYPIEIVINGIDHEFKEYQDLEQIKKEMAKYFKTQKTYDQYCDQKERAFKNFVTKIETALKKYIGLDDLIRDDRKNIIRPKKRISKKEEIEHFDSDPLFYGYYGSDDLLFPKFHWGDLCVENKITCRDTSIVDQSGYEFLTIGKTGFNAAETTTLISGSPMEVPSGKDITVQTGSSYSREIDSSASTKSTPEEDSDNSFWGDFFSSDGGDSFFDSSCGSSCGGGCGGCGS